MHGRCAREKDRAMREFCDGGRERARTTTVVEVGIDVPGVDHRVIAAERYGLAQLHQLRGRVGRG